MDRATRDRLNQLNQEFYRRVAAEFDRSRRRPWPGWQRALEVIEADRVAGLPNTEDPRAVLDLACGNGRFASFLEQRWASPFDYVGIDACEPLLERARLASRSFRMCRASWRQLDLLEDAGGGGIAAEASFDLVAIFGWLHHVPSFDARRTLIQRSVRWLHPGGYLCLTVWRFAQTARDRARCVPWDQLSASLDDRLNLGTLDGDDFLLRFGSDTHAVRYCHHIGEPELRALLDDLPATELIQFDSDGHDSHQNRYVLLRRHSS